MERGKKNTLQTEYSVNETITKLKNMIHVSVFYCGYMGEKGGKKQHGPITINDKLGIFSSNLTEFPDLYMQQAKDLRYPMQCICNSKKKSKFKICFEKFYNPIWPP